MEKILKQVNSDLLKFVPGWVYQLNLPKEYQQEIAIFDKNITIDLFDIDYDQIYIDLQNFEVDFKTYDYSPVIRMSFPFIQDWKVGTKYKHNIPFIFPKEGDVEFEISNIGLSFAFSMTTNDAGTIQPFVHFIHISLGESTLTSDSKIISWYLNQFINIGKVLIQNSVNLVGWPIISVGARPFIDTLTSNY